MNLQPADDNSIAQNPEPARSKRAKIWRAFKWFMGIGFILGVLTLIFIGVYVIRATRDLPTLDALRNYAPPVMSRVQAGDGKLIAEYGIEKRVFVPIQSIPKTIQHALVASEDQRFYEHDGFDVKGFSRAMVSNVGHAIKRERFEGGSTLTQQVAKNFLVGNDRKVERKIREVFIAKRIEKAISKDEILELYLNEVYFGRRAYGIAGASLNYFDKPLAELSLGQAAYLAGLVKGPNNYQPDKNLDRAIGRRNSVINRMRDEGYITQEQAVAAKEEPLEIQERLFGEQYLAAEYFVGEVRKQIGQMYGEDQLNEGGLSIRTTLDTDMQLAARNALRRGLEMFDRRHGYRGPLERIDIGEDWREALATFDGPPDIAPWRLAVVLDVASDSANLGLIGVDPLDADERISENGTLSLKDIEWAKPILPSGKLGASPKTLESVIIQGEVILVQEKPTKTTKSETTEPKAYNLRQVPEVNGGIIAMDPHTGRILALVGGYSFSQNQFNRVTQAYRQPGSSFKPFVYSAALDTGFTPVSQVLDAPFIIEHNDREESCETEGSSGFDLRFGRPTDDGQIVGDEAAEGDEEAQSELKSEEECGPLYYKPANFNAGKFYGLSTLRLGLEKSRNAMTVRLANDIGMTIIGQYGRRFGIYDETKPELAWALGAGETTLMRMAAAYAGLVNGGKSVTPTLLDRVQNNKGETVFIHDSRDCLDCVQDEYYGAPPPELPDERADVIDRVTAYQITSMLEGVVQRGTGWRAKRLARPIAGKTGTTNDYKDAWFMGFSPDLVTGVYVGYDTPRSMGVETGSSAAAPIFVDFMEEVLQDKPKVSFRIPQGVLLAPVDRVSGEPSYIGAPNFLLEAFKPGTEPKLGQPRSKISVGSAKSYNAYNFGFSEEIPSLDGQEESGELDDEAKLEEAAGSKDDESSEGNGLEREANGKADGDEGQEGSVAEGEPDAETDLELRPATQVEVKSEANEPQESEANRPESSPEISSENSPETSPKTPNDEQADSAAKTAQKPDNKTVKKMPIVEPPAEPANKEEVDLDDGLY